MAVPAFASECVEGSFASFVALDPAGGCTLGAATFSNFSFPNPSSTGGTFALKSASDILVLPVLIDSSILGNSNPGLWIIPDFSLTSNQPATNEYYLNYTITAPSLTGAFATSNGFAGDSVDFEDLCAGATFSQNCLGGQLVELTPQPGVGLSSTVFDQSATLVDVQNEIILQSSNGAASSVDYVSQGFTTATATATPEASPAVLSAIGLALLGSIWVWRLARTGTPNP